MQRKLIKVGTSAAVLIPKIVMDEQGVTIGDYVYVEVFKKIPATRKSVSPEIYQQTEKFRKRYQPLLKKLASS